MIRSILYKAYSRHYWHAAGVAAGVVLGMTSALAQIGAPQQADKPALTPGLPSTTAGAIEAAARKASADANKTAVPPLAGPATVPLPATEVPNRPIVGKPSTIPPVSLPSTGIPPQNQARAGEERRVVTVGAPGSDRRPNVVPEPPVIESTVPLTPLPGLGTPPTTRDGTAPLPKEGKPIIVRSQEGVTDFVYISANFPNRIATPFTTPKVIDATKADIVTRGNAVYITPVDEKPMAIFIVSPEQPARSIALTLVPRKIPMQNVIVMLEGAPASGGTESKAAADAGSRSEQVRSSDPYEVQLVALMRGFLRDRPPAGYAQEQLDLPTARMGPLTIEPIQRYSGARFNVWRYRITNTSVADVELQEQWFKAPGVRAVAFYRDVLLHSGAATNVFIIASVDDEESSWR